VPRGGEIHGSPRARGGGYNSAHRDHVLPLTIEAVVRSAIVIESPTPTRSRAERVRTFIKWLSIALLTWTIIGCVGVPLLIRHIIVPHLNKHLNGRLSVERVRCDPFGLALTLRTVRLEDAAARPVLTFDRFDGDFEAWASLFKGGWRFDHARTYAPSLAVEIDGQGGLNLMKLVKRDTGAKPSTPAEHIPRIVIRELRIVNAAASFTDLSTPEKFSALFEHADFTVENLDTEPQHKNPQTLTARSPSGETVRWTGTFSVDPLSSTGRISIEKWRLPRFVPYTLRYSPARITGGTLTASLDYDFAPARIPRTAAATLTRAAVHGLRVVQPDGALVEATGIELADARLDADARTLHIQTITLDQPAAHVRRDAGGVLNLETILSAPVSGAGRRAERPDLQTIRYPVQQLNEAILQLIEDLAGGWEVAVNRIDLRDAAADWTDRAARAPVEFRASSVSGVLGPVASTDKFRTPLQLTATLGDAGKAAVKGIILPMEGAAELNATLEHVDLAFLGPYLPETFSAELPPVRLAGAVVSLGGDAKAQIIDGQPSTASWSGELHLTSLRVNDASNGAPVTLAERLSLRGDAVVQGTGRSIRSASWKGEIDSAAMSFDSPGLARAVLGGAKINSDEAGAVFDESGGFSFAWKGKLNADSLDAKSRTDTAAELKAAAVSLEGSARAAIADGTITDAAWNGLSGVTGLDASIEGESPSTASMATLAVSGEAALTGTPAAAAWKGVLRAGDVAVRTSGANKSRVSIAMLSLDGRAEAPLNEGVHALAWSGAANLAAVAATISGTIEGEATIESLSITGDSQARVDAAGVQSASWTGELNLSGVAATAIPEDPASVRLASATVKGEAAASGLTSDSPDLRFAGDASARKLELESRNRGALQARMDAFAAQSLMLSTGENKVAATDVTLERPMFSVNAALLPPPRSADTKGVLKQAVLVRLREMVPFGFNLGRVLVTDASYEIRDETSSPPLVLTGRDGRFEIANLANDGASLADLNASLRTHESGQVRLTGKIDLFRPKPFADIKAEVSSVPLKPFDPVSGRYVGYFIDEGRAAATLPIRIEDGQLKGTLDFNLSSLDLGAATNSPEAPSVPIELGLALLKDSNNHVKGTIPLSGNIEEPGFSIGGLVWQAFLNLIVKAATAPFQILGSLLGAGEGEDLSFIDFDPGTATMPPASLTKLDTLARGLSERPSLKLDIIGRISEAEDLPALRKSALRSQAMARAGGEQMSDEQYLRGVMALYHESRGEAVPKLRAGEAPPVPLAEMESALLVSVTPDPRQLADLAVNRAGAVRDVFLKDHVLTPDRVTVVTDAEETVGATSPRADLRLRQ